MSNLKIWLEATRPKTLPAGAVPVLIGSAAAFADGHFNWIYSIIAFVCSILIQIITNFINEIYDFKRGADNEKRLGPRRAVASGLISPKLMSLVSSILILLTFALGLVLVARGGWPVLVIGIFSLAFSFFYTGGPKPLAYLGIADIFVLIFFGFVAVGGTYYVQTLEYNLSAFILGIGSGLISTNILAVNNIRDIEGDREVGKITLAVRLGRKKSVILYTILNILAFLSAIWLAYHRDDLKMLLPLIAIPIAVFVNIKVAKNRGKKLNKALAMTGMLLILFGVLQSIAFLI